MVAPLRVLIADDEPVAIERLDLALKCLPDVDIVGTARNGREAHLLIRELKPDVAILDIQMPGLDGFAVLSSLRPRVPTPEIIFVTAHNQHALRAFEVHAVDYLLKPVPFERLREAIKRARDRLRARAAEDRFAELHQLISELSAQEGGKPRYERELWVKKAGGIVRVPTGEIDFIEAAGDYVIAHLGSESYLINGSMSALQERLDPQELMRVHRSAIVNLSRVRGCRRKAGRTLTLILQSGREVAVGPNYTNSVMEAVGAKPWR